MENDTGCQALTGVPEQRWWRSPRQYRAAEAEHTKSAVGENSHGST